MISIIVAVAENGVIGDNNRLLWHISEDLRRFKRITTGHPVVMGRKTWESLGRPLPGRENVVVTRRELSFDGARTVHSLDEAYALFPPEEEVFVIGGAQIYGEALPAADRFYRKENRIAGASRMSRIWIIPENAEKPTSDKRGQGRERNDSSKNHVSKTEY